MKNNPLNCKSCGKMLLYHFDNGSILIRIMGGQAVELNRASFTIVCKNKDCRVKNVFEYDYGADLIQEEVEEQANLEIYDTKLFKI